MPTAIPMSGADAPVIRLARCQRMMMAMRRLTIKQRWQS